MDRIYMWHPLLVHFTIGLLTTSVAFYFAALFVKAEPWRHRVIAAAELNLWSGALVTGLTVGAGMIAFGTAPNSEDARPVVMLHSWLAYGTFALFAALAALSAWSRLRPQPARPPALFLAGLAVALVALSVTGYVGGELVFSHAVGVEKRP